MPDAAREHEAGADGQLLDELVEQLDRTRRLLTEGPEGAAEAVLERQGRRSAEESRLVALAQAAPWPIRRGSGRRTGS